MRVIPSPPIIFLHTTTPSVLQVAHLYIFCTITCLRCCSLKTANTTIVCYFTHTHTAHIWKVPHTHTTFVRFLPQNLQGTFATSDSSLFLPLTVGCSCHRRRHFHILVLESMQFRLARHVYTHIGSQSCLPLSVSLSLSLSLCLSLLPCVVLFLLFLTPPRRRRR